MNKTGSPTFSVSAPALLLKRLCLGEIAQTDQPCPWVRVWTGPLGTSAHTQNTRTYSCFGFNGNRVRSSFFCIFCCVCFICLWETLLSSSQELVPPTPPPRDPWFIDNKNILNTAGASVCVSACVRVREFMVSLYLRQHHAYLIRSGVHWYSLM